MERDNTNVPCVTLHAVALSAKSSISSALEKLEAVRVEIREDRCCAGRGIRDGHIAVGAQQVERVALQACPAHLGAPGKDVWRQASLLQCCPRLFPCLAIDVHLPVQCGQGGEVIWAAIVRGHPGQTVAAM